MNGSAMTPLRYVHTYLQAKLLAATVRSFPHETAINRWDEVELSRTGEMASREAG